MLTPLDYYQQQLNSGSIDHDPQQQEVIEQLELIYHALLSRHKRRFLSHIMRKSKPVKGLYLWGSVGVGKTFLMDCFYSCYPQQKLRMHFHLFLRRIHHELKVIQGEPDPLKKIAKKIAAQTSVICFDEFCVANIADAMILGQLFQCLFDVGVCLIATSNVAPDDLYKEGLQRENFLPAIAAIKKNSRVFHMVSHHDYRLTGQHQVGVYFTPLDSHALRYMKSVFLHLANGATISEGVIQLLGRDVLAYWRTDNMIWFDFINICSVPRSQHDYIALAKQYQTIFISNIPVLQPHQLNLTTAFIHLIDVLYDAKVRVVLSAAAEVQKLYPQGQLRAEFARTQSRLIEMQSVDYFA